jgi:biopolymer transport protein ExbD
MRRFSQRSHLVTLSEINITPLLDLAFVLLIIFVITTPLLEKGLDVSLPRVDGQPDQKLRREDIRTVEITVDGFYSVNRVRFTLDQLAAQLAKDRQSNPNVTVYIRADRNSRTEPLVALLDVCQRYEIKCNVRTELPGR